MDFKEIENPWSIYVLPDGRRLRIRRILTQVEPSGIGPDGTMQYNLTFSAIVVTEPATTADQVSFDLANRHDTDADAFGVAMEMPLCPVKKGNLQ